ncbi:MAG: DNA-binding protein [Lachnospiraceae bacterium]|nr:DNA-binding protein [Lachnospiraceae bacterium]
MEKIVRQSLLYDFYGELLTEHQKSIYEDIVMNDLSYSEIARLNGISRQGVYDMIKRCDKILEGYESKLKLVEKFVNARNKIADIQESIEVLKTKNQDEQLGSMIIDIEEKTSKILEDF